MLALAHATDCCAGRSVAAVGRVGGRVHGTSREGFEGGATGGSSRAGREVTVGVREGIRTGRLLAAARASRARGLNLDDAGVGGIERGALGGGRGFEGVRDGGVGGAEGLGGGRREGCGVGGFGLEGDGGVACAGGATVVVLGARGTATRGARVGGTRDGAGVVVVVVAADFAVGFGGGVGRGFLGRPRAAIARGGEEVWFGRGEGRGGTGAETGRDVAVFVVAEARAVRRLVVPWPPVVGHRERRVRVRGEERERERKEVEGRAGADEGRRWEPITLYFPPLIDLCRPLRGPQLLPSRHGLLRLDFFASLPAVEHKLPDISDSHHCVTLPLHRPSPQSKKIKKADLPEHLHLR